jgi:hypothetical protein
VRACDPPDEKRPFWRGQVVNAINIQMGVEDDHEPSNRAFD